MVVSDSRLSTVAAGKLLGLPVALIINQFRLMVPASEFNQNLTRIVDGGIMTVLSGGWELKIPAGFDSCRLAVYLCLSQVT